MMFGGSIRPNALWVVRARFTNMFSLPSDSEKTSNSLSFSNIGLECNTMAVSRLVLEMTKYR